MVTEPASESQIEQGQPDNGGSVNESVDPRANSLVFRRSVWLIWWVGTALIVMSWFDVVSNTVGWIGFAGALASSVASTVANKYWQMPR